MNGENEVSHSAEKRFGLDSCTISFAMKGNPVVNQNLDRARQNGSVIEIPPVAYYEVKRGLMAVNATPRYQQHAPFREHKRPLTGGLVGPLSRLTACSETQRVFSLRP
jgi:hypothetical protein